MAIRYKNPQTGEYEVIKIPVMKGEQGHAGIHVGTDAPPTTDVKLWFDPSDTDNDVDLANRLDTTLTACYDYMGNDRGSIKAAADANVDWLLGEINTAHYEGQQITVTDSIEGRSKNAVLKGQTLVNAGSYYNININEFVVLNGELSSDGYITMTANGTWVNSFLRKTPLIKPNTKYLVVYEIKENTLEKFTIMSQNGTESVFSSYQTTVAPNFTGILKYVATTNNDISSNHVLLRDFISNSTTQGKIIYRTMVIEYQEGMENWDIPFFRGIQSVQMPVLTTTGKNLFNPNETKLGFFYDGAEIQENYHTLFPCLKTKNLKPNTKYTASSSYGLYIAFFDKNENYIGSLNTESSKVFTTPNNTYYTLLRPHKGISSGMAYNSLDEFNNDVQIEEGSVATAYEPYKSNILSCNEEIVLGSVGSVVDTLDLLTGEVVKKTKEVVLNGSENGWNTYWNDNVVPLDNFFTCGINLDGKTRGRAVVDKFSQIELRDESEGFISNAGAEDEFAIRISKDKLETQDLKGFKKYLSQNPITVRYKLATPVVKTVDLSDNAVYSYKDTTRYTCSSEDGSLVPTLSIDVPTNLSALVTKQRQQIRTLEKENKGLNQELQLAITSSEENDNELLAQSFELDFRLMEVECALDLPMAATFRLGGKAMAMTPYEMAKKLILADNYDRADMEHKLDVYVSKKRMTEAERQELIQLMDEKEGVITIDPVEPEVEESIIEHEAVTIPLH